MKLRKLRILLLFCILFTSFSCAEDILEDGSSDSSVVYVTKTGDKYHRGDCSYLSQSKIAMSRSVAISNGYSACDKCNP